MYTDTPFYFCFTVPLSNYVIIKIENKMIVYNILYLKKYLHRGSVRYPAVQPPSMNP